MKDRYRVLFSCSGGEYTAKLKEIEDSNSLGLIAKFVKYCFCGTVSLVITKDMVNGKNISIEGNHTAGYLRTEFIIASTSLVPKAVLTASSNSSESRLMSAIRPLLLSRPSKYRDTEFLTSSTGVIVTSNSLPVSAPISSGADGCPSGRTLLMNLYVFFGLFMFVILRHLILSVKRYLLVSRYGGSFFLFVQK